jgi:hypothetical protein
MAGARLRAAPAEFEKGRGTEMDVEFFVDPVLDQAATQRAGRPIYRDVERLRISTVQGAVIIKNADSETIARWPEEWERFQAQQRRAGDEQAGVPLEDWSVPSPAQIRGLHELGIDTVDQVAALEDAVLRELDGDMGMLRTRASAFLDGAEHEALVTRLAAENDGLRRRVTDLEARNRGLAQTIERMQLQGLPPDRPGQGMIFPENALMSRPFGAMPPPQNAAGSALDAAANLPLFDRRTRRPVSPAAPTTDSELPPGNSVSGPEVVETVAAESVAGTRSVAELGVTEQ